MMLPTEKMVEAFLDAYTGDDKWRTFPVKIRGKFISRVTVPLREAMRVYLENND